MSIRCDGDSARKDGADGRLQTKKRRECLVGSTPARQGKGPVQSSRRMK